MSDVIRRMLSAAQDELRGAEHRDETDVADLIRNRIRNLERLLSRRGTS